MAKNNNIQDWLKDVADSLRIKYQTRSLINPQVIPSMVERLEKKPMVNFYDYDGELLYSYQCFEFMDITEMPTLPSKSDLICQGWNWDLDRAKEYVNKYGSLDIGAMYKTNDDAIKLHINLTNTDVTLNIGQTVSNGVTINWGDGSSETASGTGSISLSHVYSTNGEYTISLLVAENCELTLGHNSQSYPVLGDAGVFLEEVNFGSNIKASQYAFYRSGVKHISFPDNFSSMNGAMCDECYNLKHINVPKNIDVIGILCFECCYNLKSVSLNQNLNRINQQSFNYCTSLQRITIPDSVTSIGAYAFRNCYSLRNVNVGNSVTSIGYSAFNYCYSLQSVTIPNSVTTIDQYAFCYCHSLQSITIPNGVTSIGSQAFNKCYSLQSITIPDSVTSISGSAFSGCTSLQNITIPDSVKTIGNSTFSGCNSLQYIDFTSHTSIPTLGTGVFNNTPSDFEIRVPAALYNDWCNATNWSAYKDKIKHGLMGETDFIYNSLSITADDVSGRKTSTTIYYTANVTGTNIWTGNVETVDMLGTATSDSFPQNTSTTDTVERTITFELGGLTATTTITQGVLGDEEYIIDLNNQWQLSSKPNPDSSLYDGVYESFSNYNVNKGYATMYIDIFGYETFKLYIRSYAESNYDYVMVSQLDQDITGSTNYSDTTLVKAHTRGKQQSGTALNNYTLVEFTGIDKGEHRITIVYRKNSSSNSGNDRGYVLVENK